MSIIGHAGHAEGADGHLAAAEPDAVDDDSGFPLWTNHLLTRSAENWAAHTHDVHELLWGTRGTLTAQTDDGFFAVPDLVGVWIPAGVVHRVSSAPGTGFYCTYIATPVPEHLQRETLTVTVPRAARELMLHLREQQMPMSARRRASAVVVDLLAPARLGPLTVRETNSSVRHLARLFELETGMGFAQWRTLARMRAAVTLLAAGHPVNAVARRVGYRTSSAFVQAFAKVMGRTPGVYLDPGP
jgi:AraC-like DNA-binding protein